MAKLRKNERRAKYSFAFPSGSNFGAAKVVFNERRAKYSFAFPSGSNFGAAKVGLNEEGVSKKFYRTAIILFTYYLWKSDVEERYEYRHQNTQKLVRIDASGGVI